MDYILREMTAQDGGFYSATDADSEGVEGKFFVWTPEQIRAVVPDAEEARRVCAFYDITPGGNWEHTSIPNRLRPLDEVTKELGIEPDELRRTIERVKPLVYAARLTRIPPALDDKILTAWNGMMISAMAEGARVLAEPRYLRAAERAADFLLSALSRPDGGLYRTYRAGKAHLPAYLEDYAYLAEGLVDLYEAGGAARYLHEAVRLAERMVTDFADREKGGFFTTAKDHEALLLRSREGPDGAIPSGNAVAASALARLSFHYGRDDFREAATLAIRAYGRQTARYPRAFAKSLSVVDLLLTGPVELALLGAPGRPDYEALLAAIRGVYLPNRIIAHHDPAGPATSHPLLRGKQPTDGQATLYICRNFTCQAPLTNPQEAAAALANPNTLVPSQQTSEQKTLAGNRLPGHATSGGTGSYAVRMVNRPGAPNGLSHGYTAFGATGLTASKLGFGGYRTLMEEPDHREALIKALREGINVIDTSTNYADGDSERLIGLVLSELIPRGELAREEVLIVSKIGYVQGQNLKLAEAREKAAKPYPEMVKYGEGIWHCLHPDFLADQLNLSLDRLGLQTLDVLLLHNVEYFLSDAAHRMDKDIDRLRTEFYRRLQTAFAYLETQAQAGRIQYYGVSSNSCTAEPDDPEATSLSRMLESAQAAAKGLGVSRHHLAVLQCPMNLFETGAMLTANTGQDNRQTVLDLAKAEGLAVLVNRPLNAMQPKRGGMTRLAEFPLEPSAVAFEAQQQPLAKLEEEYRRTIAPSIAHAGQGMAPAEYFNWAEELTKLRPKVQSLEHWEQIESQMIAPHINQVLRALSQHLQGEQGDIWQSWRERYVPELLALLKTLRREATVKSRQKTEAIAAAIDPLLPDARRKESLSRKALWVLASTPGVTTVLNGMRTPRYVADSSAILAWEPLPHPRHVIEALQKPLSALTDRA
ncbi:MAG: aldo/keto reductase [Nitrospiraceae bacterium]